MKAFREKNKFNSFMLWATLFSFVTQPLIVSAQTIADGRDGATTPVIDQTVNGTELVHIARPHTDGVSHNLYLEFNVSSNGLILNNNATNAAVSTSQGEGIIPNFNFQGGNAASVILNEVTGGNLSSLLGDLEIAGAGAELIIANENGITCNGCGFINSTQTTLTTGKTIFDNSGNLTAFRVTDGVIDIGEEGLDASLSQSLNLLANGINVEGPVWANDLQAVAGQNNIDSETLSNTAIAGTVSTTPLIDIGSLGGMYAKQIFLVTTGAGTGVNNSGEIGASVGDLIITSDGKLQSKGRLSAQSSMALNASEIQNQGSISSRANMSLQANSVDNAGNVTSLANIELDTSRLNNEGVLSSKGTTDIEATGNVSNVGQINSAATMNVSALSIHNTGAINVENGGLTLNSQQHINNTDTAKIVVASGNVAITNATQLNNHGIISLGAGNLTINSGQVNNTSDINLEAGDADIFSQGFISNTGVVNLESGNLSITSQEHVVNSGGINLTAGQLIVDSQKAISNTSTGVINLTTGDLSLDSQTDINNGGGINLGAGDLTIKNSGNLNSSGDINLDVGDFVITSEGVVDNTGVINLDSGTLSITSQKSISSSGGINLTKGDLSLNSQNDINNSGDINLNSGNLVLISAGNTDTAGGINLSAGDLTINSGGLVNNTSVINLEAGDLSIISQTDIDNTGTINLENGDAAISSQGLVNNAGDIHLEAGSLVISSQEHLDNAGRINLEAGDLSIASQQHILNTGKINVKAGDATITAQQYLNNTGEIISDTGAIDISATELINAGDISSQENQRITANVNNTGLISSKKKLTITTQGELDNGGAIASVELLDITSAIVHNAINGRILTQNIFNITATDIRNQNVISFFGGQWDAQKFSNEGTIENKINAFVLSSASLDNSGIINNINSDFTATSDTTLVNSGTIKSDGNMLLQATNDINNSGKIASNGSVSISTQGNISNTPKNNTADATIEATGITLTGAEVINDSIIKSANDITVNATQRFNNNDQLTLVGDLIIDTNIFSNLGLANIYVGNDMWLNSNTFSNAADAAIVTEAGDLNIATASLNNNSFDNNGRIETIGGNLSILAHGNFEQNGELISKGDLTLYTGLTSLNLNNNDWSVTGNIKSNDTFTNNGIIHTEGVLKLGAYSIFNNKTITSTDDSSVVYAMKDITNNKDIYAKSGLDIIAGGNLNNSADATLISDSEFNIFVDSLFKNQGYLIGANTLSVAALEFKNNDAFISAGVLDIDVNKFSNDDKSGIFSSSDFKILAGSGGIKNDGEMFSKGKLSLTLDSVGTITNSASGSIRSTGDMLLGTDSNCRDTNTCQANSDVTLNNYNDIQSDASMEINTFRFYNGIDKPALGDWLSNDDEAIEYQGDSGRYNTYFGAIKDGRKIGGKDAYYVVGHTYEAFIDWRKEKTETRSIADENLVLGLPKISAGNQVTIRTNDGHNHGGIIEAYSAINVSRIDKYRTGSFVNEAVTTSETKTLFELGRNTYHCPFADIACHGNIDDTPDGSSNDGWKTESGTEIITAGGIIKAGNINFNDSGIKLENINKATDVKVAAQNTNVSTLTDMQPSLSPVDFNGYSDLNLYTETVLNLASLPDQIQSVSSALGIQIDGNINASITTNINTDIHTGNNTGFFPTGSNGLFVESTAPDRQFLYVLNPRIPTDNSTQIGTDYLLQKMDVDIGNILRLGDASYEQQIIEQQIAMQASTRWITDAETAGEQLTVLMDNGVEFADTNGLLVGESLTDEQILNLEKDLVWLEYSYLNGEIVLIPVVYLTQETKKHSAGAILAETIQLDVDTLGNDGGTIAATGDATIIAQGDIENIGGTIAADNLAIVSTEGAIINESVIRRVGTEDNYVDTATEALISANNDLILSANKNIEILGATVEAGNSAVVHTENGDVNVTSLVLESKTTTESHTQTGLFSSEHTKTVTTEQTQQTAGINVGGNLNKSGEGSEQNLDSNQGGLLIYAQNGAVNLTGADISSTDDITIFADDVVTSTLALYSSTTTDTESSGFAIGNGSIGVYSNDSHSESDATTASGTTISAGGNLLVDATNDIILEGGSISADTGAFNAGNNFTTLAAADTSSTRENSSESQAGIQVGDGGISGSASTTTSSSSTDSTLYSNVDMQFEDGVSITARDTVDIGGLDLAVINVAEVVEPEPVPEANAENAELVENAEQPEQEIIEIAEADEATDSSITDIRSHLNTAALVAQIVSGTSDISTVAALTSQAIQDIQPEIALGSATITGDKVISTKFENTYSETSSTSTTSVGFSAGASDNGDGTSSVNASIGGGTSSASGSTDILAENMNTISAGDLTISGKQSVDLVGVNLVGQDSVSLQSEGDINITAAKYVEELTSESSDTSFGISAGITVINGKQPTEEATDDLIVNPFAPPASASIGVAFNSSNASSASTNNGHIDSSIISNGDVSIESGEGDISFKGVAVQANKTTIKGNSFTAAAYEDSFESSESSTQVGINLTASTDITESANSLFKGNGMQHSDSEASGTQEMGNTLVANELIIDVKNDVTIVGGDISAGKVDIKAHTVDLVAAKATLVETKNESGISLIAGGSAALGGEKAWANADSMKDGAETGTSSSSGLADRTNDGRNNGGKAISDELVSGKIGLNITTRTEETTSTTYTNANIQFENLNIDTTDTTHSDDGHVDIGGANLVAFAGVDGESRTSSIDIKTGAVNTTKYVDTTDTNVTDTSTFVGVVVEGHSAIVDTYNHEITAQKKADEGMTADEGMRNAQHAADGMNMLMGDAAGGSASAAIKNSVTISNTSSTSENINYVNADNISITATEGNIDLKGVEFNAPPSYNEETGEMEASTGPRAQSISLNAKQDVNIEAAKSTFSETSTTVTTDLTLTASASVSATGSGMGVDAGYNGSMTTDSMDKTTYSNAQLNADNISITSENLALTGANVNGGNVDINVTNDITVTSVQDTQTQTTDRANWGGSAGLNTMTVVSASVQGGGGSSHDNYQKTAQQSGISAESSLNVVAGNNLTLTGASLGVAEGGTGSVTAKTITANKLEDSHDKDGLFAGGGFGIDEGGVNANVDLETVDKIDQQITQNSTISGISINTENPIQGNNLTASGELQTNAITEVKNERIAGVYLNTSVSTAGNKELAQSASAGVKTAKTKAVGATSAVANKILSKKTVVTAPPIKKAASNLKNGHTKTSTESVIVVIPANKDGKSPDTVVQNAADAIANKQTDKDRNVVVVKENQDGSLQVVKGDMETVTGNTKIDVVSHGNNLKDSGAESVATLINKVADESGLTDSNKNSDLTKVNLTACGDCNKTDGKTIGEQVTTQLVDKGLTPSVKEHDSKVQVQKDGTVVAFNNESNAAQTLTHQVKEGVVVTTTETKNIKHLTDQPLQNALVKGDDDSATNGQWVDGQPVDVNGLPFTMNMSHENDQQAQIRIDNLNTWLPTERKIIQQTQVGLQKPDSNVFKQSSYMVHDQRGEIARHINEAPIKPLTQSEVSLKVSDHKETLDDAGIIQLLNEIKNTGEAIFVQKLMAENSTLPKFEVDTASNLSPEIQHKQYQDKVLTDHIKTLDEKNQMKLVEEISSIGERLIAEQLVQDQKRQENVEWVTTKRPQDGSTAYKETMALMASGAEGPLTIAQSAQGAQAAAAGYQILSKDDGAVTAGIKNKEIVQEQVPASYTDRKTVNDIVAPIKAVRDVDPDPVAQNKAQERAEKTGTAYRAPVSHPTASKHGVILANDPGTQSRDAHGLPIMTGTSGTTASVTRSVIRSRATNNAVDKKTPVNAETLQKLSIAAEGLSDMQAANAVKDLALTWMRDGAFSQALKTGIDGRLKKTDDAYQSVNEDLNRVQTHSYPEVAEGFDRTMNLKNKDKREIADQIEASSKESLDRLKANKAKYDSAVVVMTRDKDGEISTAVKDSADDIKQQYPDTVVLIQNQDGSVDVGENGEKLKNIKGDTRIDVIGHGSDLKDKGADQVATLIDKVASEIDRNENESKVTRAEIVACGDCAKKGEKTFGQQVVEKMSTKDVAVAEHDTPIQVNQDGSRTALKTEQRTPKKIITVKTDAGVTTRSRDKKDSEMAAVLDSTRVLTLRAELKGVPEGFEGQELVASLVGADDGYHVQTKGKLANAANDDVYRKTTGLDSPQVGRIRDGNFERGKTAKYKEGDSTVHLSRRGSIRLSQENSDGSVSYTRISSGATSKAIRQYQESGGDFNEVAKKSLKSPTVSDLPNAAKTTTTEVSGINLFNTTEATSMSGSGVSDGTVGKKLDGKKLTDTELKAHKEKHQQTMALMNKPNTDGRIAAKLAEFEAQEGRVEKQQQKAVEAEMEFDQVEKKIASVEMDLKKLSDKNETTEKQNNNGKNIKKAQVNFDKSTADIKEMEALLVTANKDLKTAKDEYDKAEESYSSASGSKKKASLKKDVSANMRNVTSGNNKVALAKKNVSLAKLKNKVAEATLKNEKYGSKLTKKKLELRVAKLESKELEYIKTKEESNLLSKNEKLSQLEKELNELAYYPSSDAHSEPMGSTLTNDLRKEQGMEPLSKVATISLVTSVDRAVCPMCSQGFKEVFSDGSLIVGESWIEFKGVKPGFDSKRNENLFRVVPHEKRANTEAKREEEAKQMALIYEYSEFKKSPVDSQMEESDLSSGDESSDDESSDDESIDNPKRKSMRFSKAGE
jgi:filamentous hemagglutinin